MGYARATRFFLAPLAGAALLSCGSVVGAPPGSTGPQPSCVAPTDQDVSWVESWCGDGEECNASIIVPGPGGDILVVGTGTDGAGPGDTGFVERLSADGQKRWSRPLPQQLVVTGAAATTDGWILVGSAIPPSGSDPALDLDGIGVVVHGSVDGIVARLDQGGKFSWALRFGDDAVAVPCMSESCAEAVPVYEEARSIAVDRDGTLVVTGLVHGDADLFGTAVHTAGKADAFVARLSSSGDLLWHHLYGGPDDETPSDIGDVAIAPDQGLVTVLPGGALTKLSPGGDALWSVAVAAQRLAVAPNGDVVAIGPHPGPDSTFEGASISRVDGQGHLLWERHFGETKPPSAPYPTETTAWALSLDASGNAVVAGTFCVLTDRACAVAFGGTTLSDDKGGDVFLLDIDDKGSLRWVRPIKVPWTTIPYAALVQDDAIFLGGAYTAGFSLGGFDLIGDFGMHGFTARLARCGG